MKLGAMLRQAGEDGHLPPQGEPGAVPTPAPQDEGESQRPLDPFQILKTRAQEQLFRRLGSRLYDSSMSQEQLSTMVAQELDEIGRASCRERV